MSYAELLWVDRLGMYVSCEVEGQEPQVVRVPFLRPILDERDARYERAAHELSSFRRSVPLHELFSTSI